MQLNSQWGTNKIAVDKKIKIFGKITEKLQEI